MTAVTPTPGTWRDLAHAWGRPPLQAVFKREPEDFLVSEELGFTPDGQGEHLFLEVEKRGLTTFEAQQLLAEHFGLSPRDLFFSGMKDRQAVTRQWFSLQPGRREADIDGFTHPQLRIRQGLRNSRKLRRGTHRGNRFRIVLRDCTGDAAAVAARLDILATQGVPNYYGRQRFGRDEGNVAAALAWFAGGPPPTRPLRSLLLSSARSYLFNALLSARVEAGNWNGWIPGDLMALAGSGSVFPAAGATPAELDARLADFDISATGPLWGAGEPRVSETAAALEHTLLDQYPALCAGLAQHGLEQERRPLRLVVEELEYSRDGNDLVLDFRLDRGAYATAVLRELLFLEN